VRSRVGDRGLEDTQVLPGKTEVHNSGAAKNDALLAADDSACDSDLARLVAMWSKLDHTARQQILAIAGL
jgi:hypothetical protein